MKTAVPILILLTIIISLVPACKSSMPAETQRPGWVHNRPSNPGYFVGIGNASKKQGNLDYQQIAKKNALDDLVSEIKVTVSTNSVLKQNQTNLDFTQQFNATTRTTALHTIEHFDVVGSWENKDEFWIYYRLSKAEYEDMLRKRMLGAINRAEGFMDRADGLPIQSHYTSILQLRVVALISMQQYLNEDIRLVNEIFNSIQDQLGKLKIVPASTEMKGTVGKPLQPFVDVKVMLDDGSPVANLPLRAGSEGVADELLDHNITDEKGIVTFTRAHVQGKGSIQFMRVAVDLNKLFRYDTISPVLRNILLTITPPSASVKVVVEPLYVYLETDEQNLSKKMVQDVIRPQISRSLTDAGCILTNNPSGAHYLVRIKSNTETLGSIWGNMQSSNLEITATVVDAKSGIEVHRNVLQNIRGFQMNPENAGIDAYKKAAEPVSKTLIPGVQRAIFGGN